MQRDADAQDTPLSMLIPAPRSGLGTIDHLTPFHRSVNVRKVPSLVSLVPPAVQADAAGQDTATSSLFGPSGLGTIDHRWPFQASASVVVVLLASVVNPTAMQAAGEAQDTPHSSDLGPPGAAATDHRRPFHVSTSGYAIAPAPGPAASPAAAQNPADGHETPFSSALPAIAGFGEIAQLSAGSPTTRAVVLWVGMALA